MTLAQETQPYGPLGRFETTIDGCDYAVVRGDKHPTMGVRFNLFLVLEHGSKVEAHVYVKPRGDSVAEMREAVSRHLGAEHAAGIR